MSVSHPGARPADLVFPFDRAQAAVREADRLADVLIELCRSHEAAARELFVDFEGEPRRELEAMLEASMEHLRGHAAALQEQAAHISRDIDRATERSEQRRTAQRRYDEQLRAWQEHQRVTEGAR